MPRGFAAVVEPEKNYTVTFASRLEPKLTISPSIVCKYLILLNFFIFSAGTSAQIRIEVIGGGATQRPPPLSASDHPCNYSTATNANQISIAIAPFREESGLKQRLTSVIATDFTRSGLFTIVDNNRAKPQHEPAEVIYVH